MAMERRKILIVSYAYPRPGSGWGGVVGGERMLQFAKHLPGHGVDVCVLTHRGRVPFDGEAPHHVYAAVDSTRWLMELLRPAKTGVPSIRGRQGRSKANGAQALGDRTADSSQESRVATSVARIHATTAHGTDLPHASHEAPANDVHQASRKTRAYELHGHSREVRGADLHRPSREAPRGNGSAANTNTGSNTPTPAASAGPREGWRLSDLRTRARRFMLPDRASFAWAPFAFAEGMRVFKRERPQLILSSSPPMAAHLVAAALATRFQVPWIADVRDGYSFEAPEGSSPVRALRRSFERHLYAHAARLLSVSDALRDDFRSLLTLPAEHIVTVENGYDAALFDNTAPPLRAADDPWTVLYAGSTSFGAGRNLKNLLRGIDRFTEHAHAKVRARLMGLFAGSEIPPVQHTQVELTGWRSREDVLHGMLTADVLVVLTGNHRSVATTKLFEYIGAGRPILVVGRDSAAARIVLKHGFGLAADDTPESIARALDELHVDRAHWRERLGSEAARNARKAFSRQGQAAVLAEHIHALLEQG